MIYKYMSFEQFVGLVEMQCSYLTRIDKWSDCAEGVILSMLLGGVGQKVTEEIRQVFFSIKSNIFAQCWVNVAEESDAMWRLYASGGGVRIAADEQLIKDTISSQHEKAYTVLGLSEVWYSDQVNLIKGLSLACIDETLIRWAVSLKRKAFEYEKECRFIVCDSTMVDFLKNTNIPTTQKIKQLKLLHNHRYEHIPYRFPLEAISEVVLAPGCKTYQKNVFKPYCDNHNLNGKISILY
ncbi:MAG: DUF2971 domain-containing protein [Selenomonadaceae bacterium]|nr:DUF2971 domain-containing protein [Selenomonadaceae bacterium]